MAKKRKKKKNSIKLLFLNIGRTLKLFWKISPGNFILFGISIGGVSSLPFVVSYLNGQLLNQIVDYLASGDITRETIYTTLSLVIVSGFLLQLFYKLSDFADRRAFFDWHEHMTTMLSKKLAELDFERHENSKFHTKLNKVKDGYEYRPGQFSMLSFWIINDLIQIVAAGVIIVTLLPLLLPVIIIALAPQFVISIRSSKLKWGIWSAKGEVNKKYWETKGILTSERTLKEVKIFGTTSYLLTMMQNLLGNFLSDQRKILRREQKLSLLASLIDYAVGAAIEFWLLLRVLARTAGFGIGDFRFYLDTMNKFSDATRNLLRNLSQMYEHNLFISDMFDVLAIENQIVSKTDAVKLSTRDVPDIEFKNVSFKYPGTEDYVFKNFSLALPAGHDIALVGENGAGKTTFVKLLARFYDVDEGQILVNGTDLRDLDLDSWYRNIGILFQDFNKYGYTVKENIKLGDVSRPENEEDIIQSSKAAGADSFVMSFKHKYDQILSKWFNKGVDLSGGQWQRIALARAFYRDANILILDEPTSAIDAKGEYEIFEKISKVQKEKTTIIISHRFSTVKKANSIYVIDKGQIIESGSHEELMQLKNGKYKEMFELQAEGYR